MTTDADQMFAAPEQQYREDEAPKEVPRDRWGRPLIKQPDGKAVAYIRASTLSSALDDKTALGDWKARMTGRGVATSPDLIAGFSAIPDLESREGKKTANELAEQAQERAGSTTKRTLGTAFHSFSETYDRGRTVQHLPEALAPLMRNYVRATHGIRWLAIEQFVVVDDIRAAGTADRIGQRQDMPKPRVFDTKTGRVDYGQMKFAAQLAIYAHGRIYNAGTGERISYPAIDLEVGHVIHADPLSGEVEMYEVDLEFGWWAAQEARRVYEARKRKDIMRKMDPPSEGSGRTVIQRMGTLTSLDALRRLYQETGSQWGDRERKLADEIAKKLQVQS